MLSTYQQKTLTALAVFTCTAPLWAAPLSSAGVTAGISGTHNVDFSSLDSDPGGNGEISDQFASQGVLFTQTPSGSQGVPISTLFYDSYQESGFNPSGRNGFEEHYLGLGQLAPPPEGSVTVPYLPDVVTILFTNTVRDASFSFFEPTNLTSYTIESYLGATLVESYSTLTTPMKPPEPGDDANYYGFTGSLFDSIRITLTSGVSPAAAGGSIGAISFNLAAPEIDTGSATLPLAFVSLLLLSRKRRKATA